MSQTQTAGPRPQDLAGREITPARYAFIDALRGLAIFGVIVFHVGLGLNLERYHISDFTGLGNDGVQLFYVVSAFSLMLSLAYREKKKEPELLGHYLVRRFMRIAPMFYLAIVIWLGYRVWNPFQSHTTQPSAAQLATAVFFVNGWIPSHINAVSPGCWSVAIETNFYLLLPLAFRWIRSLRSALVATAVLCVGGALLSSMMPGLFPNVPSGVMNAFKFYWLPEQLCVFSLGLVLFFLFQRMRAAGEHTKGRALALLLASGAVFALFAFMPDLSIRGHIFKLPMRHFFVSIGFVLLAISLGMRPNKLIVNRFWILLGQISFSAYLLHFIFVDGMFWALKRCGFPVGHDVAAFAIVLPCVVVLTMAVSWCTYRAVELPGQAAGKWIIRRMQPKAAVAIA